jgi:TRAP-type mannitol/chloroaromatic compound transport system substrate-binding protein
MAPRVPALLALILLASFPAKGEDTKPVTLVTPIIYGTHLPGLGAPAVDLAKLIKERSGGMLTLDLKQPGKGTNAYEILDKVADGSIDAGFTTASFWAAKIPAAALFAGFPFGPDGKAYLDWFEIGNGRKLYQELYDHAGVKVHVLPCAFGGAETGGWFAKEIASKKGIKGLRMRIFGLGARVMAKLGATPMLVPGSDLPKAFDKKQIDAAELYPPAADRPQGLQEKVKLIYVPGWHQPETVLELIVNQDRWNALSDAQRGMIEGACRDMLQSTLASSAQLQAEALAALASDGVRIAPWPDEVLAALRAAWTELAKEEGERDYFFQEALEDIEKFRAKQPLPEETGTAPVSAAPQTAPARSSNPRASDGR